MTSMFYSLIPIALLVTIFLLVRLILSNRYKSSAAAKIVISIFILSIFSTAVYYVITVNHFRKNQSDYINPAIEWRKIDLLQVAASSLEYRSGIGVFAVTDSGEMQLTKPVPYCRVENQSIDILPEKIEIADTPFAELPAPPQNSEQQIIFEIRYAVDYDTDAISSFAILDNGEVWCTERVFRGPGDFPNASLLGLGIVITSAAIFVGSLFALLVLTIVSLEIYRWRKSNRSN